MEIPLADNRSETETDKSAESRFNETLSRLMSTPHKPHEPLKKGREPKPAPKASSVRIVSLMPSAMRLE